MTLRRRVLLGAALTLLFLLVSSVILLQQYLGGVRAQSDLRDALAPAADAVQALVLAQANASASLSDYVLLGRPESLTTYRDSIGRAERLLTQIDPAVAPTSDLTLLLDRARLTQLEWVLQDANPTLEQLARGDEQAARRITGSGLAWDSYQSMTEASERLLITVDDRRDFAADRVEGFTFILGVVLLSAGALLVLLFASVFIGLNRIVLRPLDDLRISLRKAAQEALHDHVILPSGPSEISAVGEDAENLRRQLVTEIDVANAAKGGLTQEAPVVTAILDSQLVSPDVHVNGLTFFGTSRAAEGVMSGDWWDAVVRPDGSLGVVVADVSGHGPAAGVTAVRMRPLLQAGLLSGASPDFILNLASATMTSSEHFITALLIIIDPRKESLTWANAGHEPALIVRANNEVVLCHPTGMMLSSLGGQWSTHSCSFASGDLLIAFTDGLVESKDATSSKPNAAQLTQFLQACTPSDRADVREIAHLILSRARQNSADWSRDDVTLFAVAVQR